MAKKYIVADGNCFTSNGIIYGPGDELPDSLFTDKQVRAAMIAKKRIVEQTKTTDAKIIPGSGAKPTGSDDTGSDDKAGDTKTEKSDEGEDKK